jgi:phosphate transport system substrate-binding protein
MRRGQMTKRSWMAGITAVLLTWAAAVAAETVMVDAGLPMYQRVGGIAGNLNSIGSDTLNNLMTFWAEGFAKQYPNVKVQIEGKGSSTAPPALIAGTAQLGPMSRPMKASEIDAFEKKHGYKPVAIGVALDALAVYVNKDNPIQQMNMQQVDAVFSSTRSCGGSQDIKSWAQLGLTGEWTAPISLYGRNSASGTYGYFKEHALCKGDYKGSVKEQPGSATVVEGVTNDRFGIGYSGIGYKTAGVRAVPLSAVGSTKAYDATADDVYAGTYPLSRYLYVYINRAPGQPLDPLVKQFVLYVLSKEGQEVVVKDGYVPLAKEIVEVEMKKLE